MPAPARGKCYPTKEVQGTVDSVVARFSTARPNRYFEYHNQLLKVNAKIATKAMVTFTDFFIASP